MAHPDDRPGADDEPELVGPGYAEPGSVESGGAVTGPELVEPGATASPRPPGGVAPLGSRAAARLVDILVVVAVQFVLVGIFVGFRSVDDETPVDGTGSLVAFFGALIFSAAYEVFFLVWRGQTPGKIAFRLRVVEVDGGDIPTGGTAFRRWILPGGLFHLFGIYGPIASAAIYTSAIARPDRRGWHDRIAGTQVVTAGPRPGIDRPAPAPGPAG